MPQNHRPITVYVNPHGDIVVRQQGNDDDQTVVMSPDHVPVLVSALEEARRAALQVA